MTFGKLARKQHVCRKQKRDKKIDPSPLSAPSRRSFVTWTIFLCTMKYSETRLETVICKWYKLCRWITSIWWCKRHFWVGSLEKEAQIGFLWQHVDSDMLQAVVKRGRGQRFIENVYFIKPPTNRKECLVKELLYPVIQLAFKLD